MATFDPIINAASPPLPQATMKVIGKVLANSIATNADQLSELQRERLHHCLDVPAILKVPHVLVDGEERNTVNNEEQICSLFPRLTGDFGPLHLVHLEPATQAFEADATPLRVGIVLSGGQAAGGHNVIWGLYEYLRHRHPGSTLLGFLDGPKGVMQKRYKEITSTELDKYKNLGGFHLLGSGGDKIEKPEQLDMASSACTDLQVRPFFVPH